MLYDPTFLYLSCSMVTIACVSIFVAMFRACLPARKPPPPPEETAFHVMAGDDDDDDDYEHTGEEGYEEERPNVAFINTSNHHNNSSNNGGHGSTTAMLSSSPSSIRASALSSSLGGRMGVTPSSPRLTSSPVMASSYRSNIRTYSGGAMVSGAGGGGNGVTSGSGGFGNSSNGNMLSQSPHDHAAYVYLPHSVNDD
jgi:hypothetical protein